MSQAVYVLGRQRFDRKCGKKRVQMPGEPTPNVNVRDACVFLNFVVV